MFETTHFDKSSNVFLLEKRTVIVRKINRDATLTRRNVYHKKTIPTIYNTFVKTAIKGRTGSSII